MGPWDRVLPGFGVRVYPSGGKVYIAQARERTGKKLPKRVTVGRHDVLNADEARQRAALILARIRAGEEPLPLPLAARANGGPTVADLALQYLEEHVEVRLKPRTQVRVGGVLRNHILPALGRTPVAAVERSHVVDLQQTLSAHPVTANKAVKILSHMFRLGEGWGLVPEGSNPCRSVEKFAERSRERFLTDAEFARLGRVLDDSIAAGRGSPAAVAAIRLLMLTGCRRSEILTLRWTDVDLETGELNLADAKSGPRAVQLPPTAVQLLTMLPRRKDSPWVFPGNDRQRPLRRRRSRPRLAHRPGQGGTGGRPAARSPSQLRVPRPGARRDPAGDRQAARPQRHRDHGPLRPPGARLDPRGRRENRGQHCGRYLIGTPPGHLEVRIAMKLISWNMAHRREPWRNLLDMDIDLALLQEPPNARHGGARRRGRPNWRRAAGRRPRLRSGRAPADSGALPCAGIGIETVPDRSLGNCSSREMQARRRLLH